MPVTNSKIVHVIPEEGSDSRETHVGHRMRSTTQSSRSVARSNAKEDQKRRRGQMRNLQSESRKARRTTKAREGIVSGTTLPVPPAFVRLRQSTLYQKLIPKSICREEELDLEIEKRIIDEGLEDEDLVETGTEIYKEALYSEVLNDEGFGANDV